MRISVLGAPGTGKTWLVQELSRSFQSSGDLKSTVTDNSVLMTARLTDSTDLQRDAPALCDAARIHRSMYDLTLLMGLDIPPPSTAFAKSSTGPREMVDARLRQWLAQTGISYSVIYGLGATRLEAARQAITSLHLDKIKPQARALNPWKWSCDKCSDAQCEHRMFTERLQISRQ